MKFKDISGQKFGRLTVIYRLHNHHDNKNTHWLCVCECGNLTEVSRPNLINGHNKSCGCLNAEKRKTTHTKHGKCKTRIYTIWINMKSRCYNKNDKAYKNYGERGIKVCDEWLNNFEAFYDWSINNGYNDSLTIDRIDVNGNYEHSNCQYVTMKQQARNKRNNRNITINGDTRCLLEWCETLGLKYQTVFARLNEYNWTIEQALELENKS